MMLNAEKNAIWVIAEHSSGEVGPVTLEVVAFAESVGKTLGKPVKIVVAGHRVEEPARSIAADTGCDMFGIDCDAAKEYNSELYRFLLKTFFEDLNPEFIFIPHTSTGWDYGPALAVDMGARSITAVTDFKDESGPVFVRQLYNGKIYRDIKPVSGKTTVVTVMPGVARADPPVDNAEGAVEIMKIAPPANTKTKTVRCIESPPQSINLKEAEVIIALGRGVGDPDNIDQAGRLAGLFDRGAVGASRPLCDMGWMSIDHQIGMTGQTVSPKLYIACGISGAIQHTMGMKDSKLIISVNRDRNALIRRTAHYCVEADMHGLIPILINKISELKK